MLFETSVTVLAKYLFFIIKFCNFLVITRTVVKKAWAEFWETPETKSSPKFKSHPGKCIVKNSEQMARWKKKIPFSTNRSAHHRRMRINQIISCNWKIYFFLLKENIWNDFLTFDFTNKIFKTGSFSLNSFNLCHHKKKN